MHVRLALPEEAEILWQVRNQAIRYGCKNVYPEEVIAAWTPDSMPESQRVVVQCYPFFVVVTDDEQIVASGFLDLDAGSVEAVFTLPAWQGKGLATMIINAIKHEARARGFTQLTLASTPNACRFYQRQGFIIIKESIYPSSLAGADLPCTDMRCELIHGEA
ncbi:GNAT family N-acetyltransferase [Vagococcus sp. WN89Y]|uniref:GNAT family N-acetyltransferase n=1 Tax=Vagococcus sp. WN89Y TaxID=3457258 RepID=UPI003FCCFFAF